jgi:tRNA threonylcarbamoyladenosine biosynthesis protein TsaB
MRILLIDTCGSAGSVALADTAVEPVEVRTEAFAGRTSAERLLPAIRGLLAGEMKLDAVVVVHGPGSFTGVRVGVSAAKGLSEALGVGVVAVSRLAVIARLGQVLLSSAGRIYAVLDAGRGEFYFGEYGEGGCAQEALLGRDEVLAAIAGAAGYVVTCDGAVAAALAEVSPTLIAEPLAEDALEVAMARIEAGLLDDVGLLDANYLRRTDAQIFAKPKAAG